MERSGFFNTPFFHNATPFCYKYSFIYIKCDFLVTIKFCDSSISDYRRPYRAGTYKPADFRFHSIAMFADRWHNCDLTLPGYNIINSYDLFSSGSAIQYRHILIYIPSQVGFPILIPF